MTDTAHPALFHFVVGAAALVAALTISSATVNRLVKRKLRLSIFLLGVYLAFNALLMVNPGLLVAQTRELLGIERVVLALIVAAVGIYSTVAYGVAQRTHEFGGRYHVLQGAISPIEGIGPEQLRVKELVRRVGEEGVEEVIVCTNPNTEGEVTAMYLARMLKPLGLKVTRIAAPGEGRYEHGTIDVLQATGWNFTRAAARLGQPRNTLRYRAERLGLAPEGQPVKSNWAQRIDVRERFLEEARILRRADSDHVVRVYDVGEVDHLSGVHVLACDRCPYEPLVLDGDTMPVFELKVL